MSKSSFTRQALIIGLISAAIVAGFVRLGFWQLDRARQKLEAYALFERNAAMPAAPLEDLLGEPAGRALWRTISVRGQYVDGINVLLDNQSHNGRPGYFVYSPFQPDGEDLVVLINRGWMQNDGRREAISVPPPPATSVEISAHLGKLPTPGIRLAGDDQIERINDQLYRVQTVSFDALAGALNLPIEPQVLLLDGNVADPLVREWGLPASDDARHRSYAVQWFAMAAALTIINLVLLIRSRR
jgi:surfeit locus 1 family protein